MVFEMHENVWIFKINFSVLLKNQDIANILFIQKVFHLGIWYISCTLFATNVQMFAFQIKVDLFRASESISEKKTFDKTENFSIDWSFEWPNRQDTESQKKQKK